MKLQQLCQSRFNKPVQHGRPMASTGLGRYAEL